MREKPWFYETPEPHFFNEWTQAHLGSGVAWGLAFPESYVGGFAVHTLYEMVEGRLFSIDMRDVSMRNHVGDTIAFLAGAWLGSRLRDR